LANGHVIGVDLGGTKISAGLVDAEGNIERSVERPTPIESHEALLSALLEVVRELQTPEVAAVGFGVPARVDQRTGAVLGAVNIPLHDLQFRTEMREWLGLPVTVDNDASTAALAEHQIGAGRGASELVLLTLGTGVGGGVVTGGRLYRGWAELGHMVIVEDGEPCPCTGRGHLESYCSGVAADRLAQRVIGPDATAHDLVEQRHEGLAEIGRHLGTGIGSLVNIFGPEIVVIGGGFGVHAFEPLLEHARESIQREALGSAGDIEVVPAQLGVEAGMVGAALAARDALDSLR
jgi:glucokinase